MTLLLFSSQLITSQVYRVGDLEKTIEYYKKHFGMQLLRLRDVPEVRGVLSPYFFVLTLLFDCCRNPSHFIHSACTCQFDIGCL